MSQSCCRFGLHGAPGPSGDYNNDGRLDMFLPNWWIEAPSMLLQNQTPGGHWLQVQIVGPNGVNRMGVGARVKVYPTGKLGDDSAMLCVREVSTGFGYASGQPAIAHIGLGETEAVDLRIVLPHGKGAWSRQNVAANQRITLEN